MSNTVQVIKKQIMVEGRVLDTVLVTLQHENGFHEEGMTMPQLVKLLNEDKARIHLLIKTNGWSLSRILDKHVEALKEEGVISLAGRRPNFVPKDTVHKVLARLVGGNAVADEVNRQLWGDAEAHKDTKEALAAGDIPAARQIALGTSAVQAMDIGITIDANTDLLAVAMHQNRVVVTQNVVMEELLIGERDRRIQETARADKAEASVLRLQLYAVDGASEYGFTASYVYKHCPNIRREVDDYCSKRPYKPGYLNAGWTTLYLNDIHALEATLKERIPRSDKLRNLFNQADINEIEKSLGEIK